MNYWFCPSSFPTSSSFFFPHTKWDRQGDTSCTSSSQESDLIFITLIRTDKRLKERFLTRRNRTKHANF